MTLVITPETTIGALLEAYPGAEDSLIAAVPQFASLRNPVLRSKVAGAATLEQAAKIGGVSLPQLVRTLRAAAGQAEPAAAAPPFDGAPEWLVEERVKVDIDADSMLERGVHPVGDVRNAVAALAPGEIVRLKSGFRPSPLIDMFLRNGTAVYSREVAPGRHVTWFCRQR